MRRLRPRAPSASIFRGVFAVLNSRAVARLTLLSVACADRMTATSSSNGVEYPSSVLGAGLARFRRAKIAARFVLFIVDRRIRINYTHDR